MAWNIDAAHSRVGFAVKHMMVATVKGQFNVLGGTVNIDEANLANSWVEAEIDASSIDTRDAARDGHLHAVDFLDTEKFPKITFKSTKVEPAGDNEYNIIGDLTLHGVTKSVVLKTEYFGAIKDPYGLNRAGFEARTKISRKEFGLAFNAMLETGGAVVSDEVKIDLDIEAVAQ